MTIQFAQSTFRYPNDLQEWQKLYCQDAVNAADRLCAQALAGFGDFSRSYSDYFEEVLRSPEFARSRNTESRLRAQVSNALNAYWNPVGEVATQRQVKFYQQILDDQGTKNVQEYLNALKLNLPGVLIYFNKVTSISYCPYTRIAFVGTPYFQLANDDWQASAHELGHYVYWNLGGTLKQVREQHRQMSKKAASKIKAALLAFTTEERKNVEKMMLSWLEEMFCDVVGTRLGGDAFIQSLKNLITNTASTITDLTKDDGRHPPFCLRPYIREYVRNPNSKSTVVDWNAFFEATFHVKTVELLKLSAPQELESAFEKLPRLELLRILTGKGTSRKKALSSNQIEVRRLIPAVQAMTEFLSEQIDQLIQAGIPQPAEASQAFEQLLDLANESATGTKQPYEILLNPKILEGGKEHGPHDAWGGTNPLEWEVHHLGVHTH